MRRIGAAASVSGDQDQQGPFASLSGSHQQRALVEDRPFRHDLAFSERHRGPIYLSRDFIPWDAEAWRPMIPPEMLGGGPATEHGDK